MNPTESLALTRFVRAACPQQKFDEYTPDAWHELLADLQFADCRAAVTALGKRQPFISPAEIRTEVVRIRAERIRADMTEPEYDRDDVAGGLAAIRARRRAVGDGQSAPNALPAIDPAVRDRVEKYVDAVAEKRSIATRPRTRRSA